MKISIVMVTLNAADVVDEAMRSVRMQTHDAVELIVVDGGSEDGTLDIVGRHADLRPRILCGPDGGIYEAMNKGVAAATGQALYFLNADDRLAQPSTLASLAEHLDAKQADLAFGDILMVGPHADQARSHQRVRVDRLGYEPLSHQAVLARRSAFENVGPFDTRYRICGDLDWFFRCGQLRLAFSHVPRQVCRCLVGGVSQRQYELQLLEIQQILHAHRSPVQRGVRRIQAAMHRRACGLADRLLGRVRASA